jgi:Protein of unknown function (DUF998)
MTTPTAAMHRFAPKQFATAAIASFTCWALALLLLHALRPDRPLTTTWISGYALGPYGWVMTTGWLAASCGCVMLVLGLARSGPQTGAARLGRLLLGILALGMLITAIFPPDKPGQPSISGEIHSISFLVNVTCILLGSVFLSIGFGSDPRWRTFQRTAAILASLIVAAFVLQFVTAYFEVFYGLANRCFASVLIIWLLLTSIRLRTVESGAMDQI